MDTRVPLTTCAPSHEGHNRLLTLAGLLARRSPYSGVPSHDDEFTVALTPFRPPSQRRGRPGFSPGSLTGRPALTGRDQRYMSWVGS